MQPCKREKNIHPNKHRLLHSCRQPMQARVLFFVFAVALVTAVAPKAAGNGSDRDQGLGWDDLNCSQLFSRFENLNIVPSRTQIKEAICKENENIDGSNFDELLSKDCSDPPLGLTTAECADMQRKLKAIAQQPSSKFKDFWEWRAHNNRLADYWLLPLSQYRALCPSPPAACAKSTNAIAQLASVPAFSPLLSEQ